MLQPSMDLSSVDKSKHKFMVQSMFAPQEFTADNLDQLVGCLLSSTCTCTLLGILWRAWVKAIAQKSAVGCDLPLFCWLRSTSSSMSLPCCLSEDCTAYQALRLANCASLFSALLSLSLAVSSMAVPFVWCWDYCIYTSTFNLSHTWILHTCALWRIYDVPYIYTCI